MPSLLAFGMPGPFEWMLIAFVGLLIFGKRLPEVGRSLGKGIVEFKKGLSDVADEVGVAANRQATPPPPAPPSTPNYKFDPYTGKPIDPNTPTV